MAYYGLVYGLPTAGTSDELLALVVADDNGRFEVFGTSDVADSIREDTELDPGMTAEAIMSRAIGHLTYYQVDGPHAFEGTLPDAGKSLSRIYGFAD